MRLDLISLRVEYLFKIKNVENTGYTKKIRLPLVVGERPVNRYEHGLERRYGDIW